MNKLPAFLQPIHEYVYRKQGRLPQITGVYHIIPSPDLPSRLCYEVTYEDGEIDYVPAQNVINGYWKVTVFDNIKENEHGSSNR